MQFNMKIFNITFREGRYAGQITEIYFWLQNSVCIGILRPNRFFCSRLERYGVVII